MRQNPYVGPRSFTTGERLYGRDRELRKLANLLIAERIVLLYSPSGAGKTSLVQAALVPRLRDEGFTVPPPIRVGADPPPELAGANRYVLGAMLSLEGRRPAEAQIPLADLAAMSLGQYLDSWDAAESDGTVLIFDQFEEILSAVPNDREAKEAFFEQLGVALRPRHRWALFSMREDYLAQLDPYLRAIPTRLANRFRLDLLEAEAAMAAIQAPARAAGVAFTGDAAQQLIDDLRLVRVQRPDGTAAQEPGLYVEPVQLQVVCYRIWALLPADDNEISHEDVARIGDVTTALRSYYAERVAAAASAGASERAVRDWFDSKLITAQGIRGQVLREHGASGGLDNRAIAALVDSHLVRGEQIRGATWYELSHDRLIAPVQADNAEWRTANLSQLQRQTALWAAEGRQDGLLLRDDDLTEAEAWAAANAAELTGIERDFLSRCRQVRDIIRRERRNNRLIRILAVVSSTIGVVALILAGVASQAEKKAIARALASAALDNGAVRPQRDLLLALVSQQIGVDTNLRQGEEAIQQLLTQVGGRPQRLDIAPTMAAFSADGALLALYGTDAAGSGTLELRQLSGAADAIRFSATVTASLSRLAVSPDGAMAAGATDEGALLVWSAPSPQAPPRTLSSGLGALGPITFSADGSLLAAGATDGTISLWHSADLAAKPDTLSSERLPVTALAISPDAKMLAAGYADGHIAILLRAGGATQVLTAQAHEEQVSAIAFSPDGGLVASGSTDGVIRLTRLSGTTEPPDYLRQGGYITGLSFSRDGGRLVSSSRDGVAFVWNLGAQGGSEAALALRGHEGWVLAVSFVGDEIVTLGRDGTARRWAVQNPTATQVIRAHDHEVASVAYSPNGRWLATGSIKGNAILWGLNGDQVSRSAVITATSAIWWVAFSPDSSLLAMAAQNGDVQIWQVAAPGAPLATIHAHDGIATTVVFSPDGKFLASTGYDGAFKLWDLTQLAATHQVMPLVLASFPTAGKPLQAASFSDDGRWLAAAGDEGVIRVWDRANLAAAPQELRAPDGSGPIITLAFRPKHPGQLASSGFDAQVKIWDLNAPVHLIHRFSGHTDWVISLAFSWDGSRLASGGNDDTVRVWDPDQETSVPLVLRGHSADVETVAFSRDDHWLASGSLDTTAIIWPIDTRVLKERACAVAGRGLSDDEIKLFEGQVAPRYQNVCQSKP